MSKPPQEERRVRCEAEKQSGATDISWSTNGDAGPPIRTDGLSKALRHGPGLQATAIGAKDGPSMAVQPHHFRLSSDQYGCEMHHVVRQRAPQRHALHLSRPTH